MHYPYPYLSLHQCDSEKRIRLTNENPFSRRALNHHHEKILKPHGDDQITESHEYYQALLHLVMFQLGTPLSDLVLRQYHQALELFAGS